MKNTDEELIVEYLEGNENALTVLVDRYIKDVYQFAYQLTNDSGMSEDIVQESFVKAWKHMRNFRAGGSFKTWIFTITRNTAIDWLRKQKEVRISSFENSDGHNALLESTASNELLPDELLARAEDSTYATALLMQLDSKYQEVLTLRYSSNMTFEEIGQLLRRPLHTIKSQHRRALAMLRRIQKVESV